MWWRSADFCGKSGSVAEMQRPQPSSDLWAPSCSPRPGAEGAGAACVPSGAGGTKDVSSRPIFGASPAGYRHSGQDRSRGDRQLCWPPLHFSTGWLHMPVVCNTGCSLAHYRPDALKSHLKMFWASLLAFPPKKKTNSCIPCLTKLLPWQLEVENTAQRIISHWN